MEVFLRLIRFRFSIKLSYESNNHFSLRCLNLPLKLQKVDKGDGTHRKTPKLTRQDFQNFPKFKNY